MSPPDCSLYLLTPPTLPPDFPRLLADVLDAAGVAALRLHVPGAGATELEAAIALIRPVSTARGVALILQGDPAQAARTGCDGAHLAGGDMPVAVARRLLGPDLQLGVSCQASRDAAMQAGEEGADYVGFAGAPEHDIPELLTWWSELMELPVVAEDAPDAASCAALARAGANFVLVGDAVWNDPAGPVRAIKALQAAVEGA